MKIGVPSEIKTKEFRVGATPGAVATLVGAGHQVFVQKDAGHGSGFTNEEYLKAGATILDTADQVWAEADMIYKVKEPLGPEFSRMKEGQILFTYLHLAADKEQTDEILKRKIKGIAFETVQLEDRSLPLLAPMSYVAGRMSIAMGQMCLEKRNGGKGILLCGVPGVKPAKVTVLGGGIAGMSAARIASGMGADVVILDVNTKRLGYLDDIFMGTTVRTLMSNAVNLEESILGADLVIGSVLIPGAKAPKLMKKEYLSKMQPGSAFVDIAIDQGGCGETSHATTHDEPIYIIDGVVHYCVANMPGAFPRTSTYALSNATLPYALALANKGAEKAMKEDKALARGLNVYLGKLTCQEVGEAVCLPYEVMAF